MGHKRDYGLIGFPLSHSRSKEYFDRKFEAFKNDDNQYTLFELSKLENLGHLLAQNPNLVGFNVTIPYKEEILRFLKNTAPEVSKIKAINVVKVEDDGSLTGFNTDYEAFRQSLINWLNPGNKIKALIFGSGGSSKAVSFALQKLKMPYSVVSRKPGIGISYEQLDQNPEIINKHKLLINTTPLGMFPNVDDCLNINFDYISSSHYVFDLIYNPDKTLFLQRCEKKGAKIKNGLEMLHIQAELSWQIWQEK